jgi:4-hydroxy-tetrahydrodipicolinate reductase
MKINVGLFGGSGKMGKSIEQIIGQISSKNELIPFLFVGREASSVFAVSAKSLSEIESDVLADVHVWIDFTSEKGLLELLSATSKHKTAVVSGSTGLSPQTFSLLKKSAKTRKIFWASNMSPGLWAFRQAMKSLSSIANFDFAIEEIHHTQKKDLPSGTAKTLHSDLEGIVNKRVPTPSSFRLGGVFGVHTLYAASANELITMQHSALNRSVFAEGAVIAAHWLASQRNGYYSMDNLFSQKSRSKK